MSREQQRLLGKRPYARWSFLFAIGGVALVLIAISSARETYQGWKVDQEIQGLQAQVEALEGRRLHLAETLSRLQSPDTLDKEARLRLGLQKPGEQVFVLSQGTVVRGPNGQTQIVPASAPEEEVSNPRKWFRYFFHPTL
jgi:cell division protein FtsB